MTTPPMMAMVAGTAPLSLTIASTARAVSLLTGYSIPCVMIVDSRATTGFPASIAFFTSSLTTNLYDLIMALRSYASRDLELI